MKQRYQQYDQDISNRPDFIKQGDKVNVFINFESVLKNISMVKDVDRKIILERSFDEIIISESLNLLAHYRRFFRTNKLETRVFLYSTDLESSDFQLLEFNEDYRSYYKQKYLYNPKFSGLGDALVYKIIPQLKLMTEYIDGVYFITAPSIEGSLIPLIVSNLDTSYKNLIITEDLYDTQYQTNPDFMVHYIKKSTRASVIFCELQKTVSAIFYNDDTQCTNTDIYNNPCFYKLLLAACGNKHRNIETVKGVGAKTIHNAIMGVLNNGIADASTDNVNVILNGLDIRIREELLVNYECTDLERQYNRLTKEDIYNIENQMTDRTDINSLSIINSAKFYSHPIMLNELTM